MADSETKHVFISYVHEDSDAVDGLCAVLEAAQIPYWRDRTSLAPGDAWKSKIRQAIRDGSLVFLACFSGQSRNRDKSHMNEELTLAAEEFRKMPPGRTWLIPVRFDAGELPEWDLGAGRGLSDLNQVDLFGAGHAANAASLVTTIHRVMGDKRMSPASALAAVEQATAADRTDLLRRLTKEMLLDPARRIELDDLVSQEVQRVMAVLDDSDRASGLIGGTNEEQIVGIAEEATELWSVVEPFCASLQVAARWGTPDVLIPWANGLRSFVAAANRTASGNTAMLDLRHLPGVFGIFTAAISCIGIGRWESLKVLVADPTVRDRYEQKPIPLIEATDPYKPFSNTLDSVGNALARSALQGQDLTSSAQDFTARNNPKYYTPVAEWLHHVMRPMFKDQWPDDDAYDSEFDRAEVVIGVLAQDFTNVRAASNPGGRAYGRSHWYGRSTWRSVHGRGHAVEDLAYELTAQGSSWPPLKVDLFGADKSRAEAALATYAENFDRMASSRF